MLCHVLEAKCVCVVVLFTDGYAFSQEEHGVVGQVDSNLCSEIYTGMFLLDFTTFKVKL